MKYNQEYELNLNWMSMCEVLEYRDTYNDYAQIAILMLDFDFKFEFEDDLLKKHSVESMEQLISGYINRFYHTGSSKKKNPKEKNSLFVRIWYDLFSEIIIERNNPYYSHFFAYKLRETDILKVDLFLDYQSYKWGAENLEMFLRFVQLVIRENKGQLIPETKILTATEWIRKKESELSLSGADAEPTVKVKTKGKWKREANDGKTELSQAQTALLLNYMKQAGVFWQGEYLNNKEAGLAMSVLTGYDSEAMRQNLGEKKIKELTIPSNLKKLKESLKKITDLVSRDLSEK